MNKRDVTDIDKNVETDIVKHLRKENIIFRRELKVAYALIRYAKMNCGPVGVAKDYQEWLEIYKTLGIR